MTCDERSYTVGPDVPRRAAGQRICLARARGVLGVGRLGIRSDAGHAHLGEAQRAIPGDDVQAWSRRLVEVGESLNLRLLSVECTLAEALAFVSQGKPVTTSEPAADGSGEWILLVESRGRRVRLASVDTTRPDCWVTLAELRRRLGRSARSARRNWVVGQPALACEYQHSHADDHAAGHGPSPLARLFGLIRSDWKDIRVILVFSMVVGILMLAAPIAVEALVNTVAFGRYLQPIVVLAILLLIFLGFAAVIRALLAYVVEVIQRRLFIRVVEDLAYRLPRVQQTSFDNLNGPELLNRFFEVVTVQKVVASLLLDGIAIVLQTVIGMLVLAFYHPFLLGFDIVLLLLIAFVIFVLGRGAVRTSLTESRAKYAVAAWLQELARHPTAIKLHSGASLASIGPINWLSAGSTPGESISVWSCARRCSRWGCRRLPPPCCSVWAVGW